MSAISDYATKQNAHLEKQEKAITGLQGDVKSLNETIVKLQGTQGQITPEDQALLDQIEARGAAIAEKLDALDALTADVPVVPTA